MVEANVVVPKPINAFHCIMVSIIGPNARERVEFTYDRLILDIIYRMLYTLI